MRMLINKYSINHPTQAIYSMGNNSRSVFLPGKSIIRVEGEMLCSEEGFTKLLEFGNKVAIIPPGDNFYSFSNEEVKLLLSELEELGAMANIQKSISYEHENLLLSHLLSYITEIKHELRTVNNSSGA